MTSRVASCVCLRQSSDTHSIGENPYGFPLSLPPVAVPFPSVFGLTCADKGKRSFPLKSSFMVLVHAGQKKSPGKGDIFWLPRMDCVTVAWHYAALRAAPFPPTAGLTASLPKGKPLCFPLSIPLPSVSESMCADKGKRSFPLKSSFMVLVHAGQKNKHITWCPSTSLRALRLFKKKLRSSIDTERAERVEVAAPHGLRFA